MVPSNRKSNLTTCERVVQMHKPIHQRHYPHRGAGVRPGRRLFVLPPASATATRVQGRGYLIWSTSPCSQLFMKFPIRLLPNVIVLRTRGHEGALSISLSINRSASWHFLVGLLFSYRIILRTLVQWATIDSSYGKQKLEGAARGDA
jgi:hypothetical protein